MKMTVKKLKDLLAKYPDSKKVSIEIDYATSDDYPKYIEEGCDTGVVATLNVGGDTLVEAVCEM